MTSSKLTIYGAIAANVAIAATKLVVAGITGSSAMLSEGIHSMVDTGNGVLMLWGVHKSQKPPDEEHPFGHGRGRDRAGLRSCLPSAATGRMGLDITRAP